MSASPASLTGVVPIIPTPFRSDEQIDFDGISRCVQFAMSSGLPAVCLPAYASEFYKLSEAERARCVETAIAAAGGRAIGYIGPAYCTIGAPKVYFIIPYNYFAARQDAGCPSRTNVFHQGKRLGISRGMKCENQ